MSPAQHRPATHGVQQAIVDAWAHDEVGASPALRGERQRGGESRYGALARVLEAVLRDVGVPGQLLPPERALAEALNVSRATLRAALDQLSADGLLQRETGVGTYLARPKADVRVRLASYSEDMRRRGMVPGSRVLRFETVAAPPAVAREMGITDWEPVVYLQRLLLADGEPMSVDENYLPSSAVPGLAEGRPPASLYATLAERYGMRMEWGEDQIEATAATMVQARLLKVPDRAPLLQLVRHAYVGERLVNYSACFYRADRYKLWVPLSRPAAHRRNA